jgi:phosphatidylethanolamine/phosphatidyl-N-methylethanolamine N-methyltransferase
MKIEDKRFSKDAVYAPPVNPPRSNDQLDRASATYTNLSGATNQITLGDVKNSYRRYARLYDLVFGAVLEDGRKKLLAEVACLRPHRILELGVGTGLLLGRYPMAANVIGVDISDEMLVIARKRISELRLSNTTVECGNCEALRFEDGAFDCVVLPYVLSVTPNPSSLVAEAIRVCSQSGHIILVNHFSGSTFWSGLELLVAPLAAKIGFHSKFTYEQNVLSHIWSVKKVARANLWGLSRVVVLQPRTVVSP